MSTVATQPEWKVREKHESDVRATMDRLGFVRNGKLLRFNGPLFWPELAKTGHDATALENCSCWKERFQ